MSLSRRQFLKRLGIGAIVGPTVVKALLKPVEAAPLPIPVSTPVLTYESFMRFVESVYGKPATPRYEWSRSISYEIGDVVQALQANNWDTFSAKRFVMTTGRQAGRTAAHQVIRDSWRRVA